MRFTVFQLSFTNEDYDEINSMVNPHVNHPKYSVRMKAQMGKLTFKQVQEIYKPVAHFDAEDLEHVFHISNSGQNEELITRLAPMTSVSVGDAVQDPDGNFWLVAGVGFVPIVEGVNENV